ncbi:MAG: AMIN domain-containing protein [Gemmatimonadota bacterium]
MISILALFLAAVNPAASINPVAEVKNLSVTPASGRTEVVIRMDNEVAVKPMFLSEGNRLVLDLTTAQQPTGLDFQVNRGGVRGLRVGQFKPGVVRVVIELAQRVDYKVDSNNGEVRVSFANPGEEFTAWNMALNATKASAPARTEPKAETREVSTFSPAQQRPQEERLTWSFVDQPILEVIAVFSELTGRSIIASPQTRTVIINGEIKDQPWDVALQVLMGAHGMVVTEQEGGILLVEPTSVVQERLAAEPVQTRQIIIENITADSLLEAVRSLLTADGKVAVNPAANSLLVTDVRSSIDRLVPLIQSLDVKVPQVSISAKIVFVDRTALEDLGFVYDLKDSRGNQLNSVVPGFLDTNGNGVFEPTERTDNNVIALGGNSIAGLANANFRVATPALQILTSLVLGRHSLFTFIEALQSVSVSDVQAAPVVTTIANRQARIQVGERTPIRVIDAGAAGAQSTASVRLEPTGIILRVTPMITGNQVTLDIHAERSNIGLAPADIGATFNTQEADTQVMVENGETAVIGGLTLIEKLQVRAGIPFLMDLPVLGALFRNESSRETKRDLLIMVTPHIIRDGTR